MKNSCKINVDGIGPVLFEHSLKARRIIISIQPHRGVRVAVPGRDSVDSALAFVHAKRKWIRKQLDKIAEHENRLKALAGSFAAVDRVEAKKQLTTRLKQLAEKHGFTISRIFIRKQQTRWGSCSHKNNISLNMKLIVLPENLVDYVMLHELVHTRVHDHSRRFWSELDKYVGNGKLMASKLKRYDTRWI